jgi:hypothetical protein
MDGHQYRRQLPNYQDPYQAIGNGSIVFDAPAPASSWLRFTAVGAVQYSVNRGANYQAAPKQAFIGHYEHESPYFIPVPAGMQTVVGLNHQFSFHRFRELLQLHGLGIPLASISRCSSTGGMGLNSSGISPLTSL